MLALIDFEASSLSHSSWPVEVGFVLGDLSAAGSVIVSPAPGWTDWDLGAEDIHRLLPEHLVQFGRPPAEVARLLNSELAGMSLISDSKQDWFWARRLFTAANVETAISIPPAWGESEADFDIQLISRCLRSGCSRDAQEEMWERLIASVGIIEHEALHDAVSLALGLLAVDLVFEPTREEDVVGKAKGLLEQHGRTPEIRAWTPWSP